jgi:electron transfer flavoprotein beta subunit
MPDINIVVCVKVVPKSEEIKVDPITHMLLRENVRSEINPSDMNALELALRVCDQVPSTLTILSMGPAMAEDYLRVGLAMGAEQLVLLSDRAFAGADTLATTYTLHQAIQKLGKVDLIICGEESSDGATGQVPSGLAEWLGHPSISFVTELNVDPSKHTAVVRREFGGSRELIEADLPVVIAAKSASNEPRFMDYDRKEWAFDEAPLQVWTAEDINADAEFIGLTGSPTRVTGLVEAETRDRKREVLNGSVEEIAEQIAATLRTS